MIRCIFCGYCEEACPVDAIKLGPEYELADFARRDFVYTKEMLLDPEAFAPPRQYHARRRPRRRQPRARPSTPGQMRSRPIADEADLGEVYRTPPARPRRPPTRERRERRSPDAIASADR